MKTRFRTCLACGARRLKGKIWRKLYFVCEECLKKGWQLKTGRQIAGSSHDDQLYLFSREGDALIAADRLEDLRTLKAEEAAHAPGGGE